MGNSKNISSWGKEEALDKEEHDYTRKGHQLDELEGGELEEYYEGYWKLGKKDGIGFFYLGNNSSCFGDIVDGVLHGYGKFLFFK